MSVPRYTNLELPSPLQTNAGVFLVPNRTIYYTLYYILDTIYYTIYYILDILKLTKLKAKCLDAKVTFKLA